MAKEVVWTPRAIQAYERVVDYLLAEWSKKDAEKFISLTEKTVTLIAENPQLFRELEEKHHHEALVTKHNLMIYEIRNNKVFILTIWDTRRNPAKKKTT